MPRRSQVVLISPRLNALAITTPEGREHLVSDSVLASTPDGTFLTRCGKYVVSASLGDPPGTPCGLCAPSWAYLRDTY